MADRVQYTMERMLHDLLVLEKKEVFSHREVKDIIAKRREFEYRMQAKDFTDVDFLEAIEYEKGLQRRLKEKLKDKKEEQKAAKTSTSEYSVIRRIMNMYDRLLIRYKTRFDILKRYLAFLTKEKAYRKMSSVMATYLATDSHNAEAWRIAAYTEFDVNGNAENARGIFMRGIGAVPESADLWAFYLRFELDFIAKIKEREKILKGV